MSRGISFLLFALAYASANRSDIGGEGSELDTRKPANFGFQALHSTVLVDYGQQTGFS